MTNTVIGSSIAMLQQMSKKIWQKASLISLFIPNVRETIYEQKIDFFYGFPDLVGTRQQLIEGLCSYIQ